MDSNQNVNEGTVRGSIEATDDVEGHKVSPGGLEAEQASGEDVEGHGTFSNRVNPDEGGDTEGHAVRVNG